MPNKFADFAHAAWKRKYGHEPPWTGKMYAQLSKARQVLKDERVAELSWEKYLADTDAFYQGHEPGLFLARLPRWATYPKAPPNHNKATHQQSWDERAKLMATIYADPKWTNDTERRNEYVRQVRERWPQPKETDDAATK